jgi:WD40 repeat protein
LFDYNLVTNKLNLNNRYEHTNCFLCVKYLNLNSDSYLLCSGTDGCIIIWKFDKDEIFLFNKIESIHQSGINSFDTWKINDNKILIASVGDDTSVGITEIELDSSNKINQVSIIKTDMANASSIASVKFLNKNIFVTISKDQRLILWNYENKLVFNYFKKLKISIIFYKNFLSLQS